MEFTIQGKIEIKASEFHTNNMTKLLKYWFYISKLSQIFKKKVKVYTHVPYRILNQKARINKHAKCCHFES